MSLRLRLTLFFSVFIALILSAAALSVYVLTQRSLTSALEDRARQALTDLTSGTVPVQEGLQKLPSDAYYQIILLGQANHIPDSPAGIRDGFPYRPSGYPRPNPTEDSLVSLMSNPALSDLLAKGHVSSVVSLPSGEQLTVLAELGTLYFPTQSRTFEAVTFVGIPSSTVARTLDQLARNLVLTVLLAFLASGAGVWLLSSRALQPLKRVTAAAARVSGRDLSQRVPTPRSRDEIREMAVTINHMLDRLQESFETQRRFTADASHELRTPVTAIVGHANYLLRRTHPTTSQSDSLTVIRREAERMAKLVNDLLELARADAGFSIQLEPMNLIEVLEAVHMEMAPVAGDTDIEVNAPMPVLEVLGDAARLKQVVLNLLHNAVNAGAKHVFINVSRERQEVRLEILDDGPGIPPDAIPHLFDRFYRVDGARSTRGNGSGLGLAIVRWIVQQHGGTVSVESRVGEGTVFVVMLPAQGAKLADAPVRPALESGRTMFSKRGSD
ncbi:MAG TPA: ATP-binding protein [Trueperaceae bacterium]|nr:ATP-binding protein [Trueperaceae bacterium]